MSTAIIFGAPGSGKTVNATLVPGKTLLLCSDNSAVVLNHFSRPDPQFKPMCKNGDPCHVSAPRGAKTGTQGIKGHINRSIIPAPLCEHIVKISEKGVL